MGILDKFFKVKKSDYSDSTSFSSEKVQCQYFDTILNEEALYERVAALCSMDLFEHFMPLYALDDQYIYNIDGNYLNENYFQNVSLLKKDALSLETEGHEQFEDAYGDEMPSYAELQKDIAGKLDLNISTDITEDVLPKLYQSVQRQPEFVARSKVDNICLGKLYQ